MNAKTPIKNNFFLCESISSLINQQFGNSIRLCPMFAGPIKISGSHLSVSLAQREIEIDATPKLLKQVFAFCDGMRSITEILKAVGNETERSQLARFIDFLLKSGALIDANLHTAHALKYGYQVNPFGLAAPSHISNLICRRFTRKYKNTSLTKNKRIFSTIKLESVSSVPLDAFFQERISTYTYAEKAPQKKQLLALLWSLCGVVKTQHERVGLACPRRTIASAGGMHLVQVYVALQKTVGEYTPGIYRVHYLAERSLALVRVSDAIGLLPRAYAKPWELTYATGAIFLLGDVVTASLRYRNRALQYLFMEAGAALHNGALTAPQLKLGYVTIGGYYESIIEQLCTEPEQRVDRVVLGTAIFGSQPNTAQQEAILLTPDFEFAWSDAPSQFFSMPFYLGRARVRRNREGDEVSPYTWGRGQDPWLACRKALAEAIEREGFREPKDILFGRMDEIAGACDPRNYVQYSTAQYRSKGFPYKPFDSQRTYAWAPALNYLTGAKAYVLADMVYARASLSEKYPKYYKVIKGQSIYYPYTQVSSSGCAAGETHEEAFRRAVLELIERDAFMRHWFTQQGGHLIKTSSLPFPLRKRVQALQETGCRVTVQCLTSPWAKVCLMAAQHIEMHFTTMGTAAHEEFEQAANAALDELEARVFAWLNGHQVHAFKPAEVVTPEHHFELYGLKKYFQRANQVLFPESSELLYRVIFKSDKKQPRDLFDRFAKAGVAPVYVDITPKLCHLDQGRTRLAVVKALIPMLIPMSFGHQLEPRGMLKMVHPGSKFPHPFP